MFHLEDLDCELDDDFFQDAFNVSSKGATDESLDPVILQQYQHCTQLNNSVSKAVDPESDEKCSKTSLCPDANTPTELGSTLQHNLDLPADQLNYKTIQLSKRPNNAQHALHKDLGGKKIDLAKGVKCFGQKSFMSYDERNLNSIFCFDSVKDPAENNTTSKKTMSTQCVFELHAQDAKHPISRNLSSFPALKCVATPNRTMLGTSCSNDKNQWVKQSSYASSAVPGTPLENVVNKELRNHVDAQPKNSSDRQMVSRLRKGVSLKQNSPCTFTSSTRKRKFPGPAGILPETPPGSCLYALSKKEGSSVPESQNVSSQEFACSQSLNDEFERCSWKAMLNDFTCEASGTSVPDIFNIAWVLQQVALKQLPDGKVPLLCVVVKNMCREGSSLVRFADETGEMKALIHGSVLEKYEHCIQPGTVLVLQQVSVFSPNPESHYMIVTLRNIANLYDVQGKKTSTVSSSSQLLTMAKKLMQETIRSQQRVGSGNTQRVPSGSFERKKMPFPHPATEGPGNSVLMKDACVTLANSATGTSGQASCSGYSDSKAAARASLPHHSNKQTVAVETACTNNSHDESVAFEDDLDYLISSVDEKMFYSFMNDVI